MQSKKPQTNSIDELLEIASSNEQVSFEEINNDLYSKIDKFINVFNLVTGNNKIPSSSLYKVFKQTNKECEISLKKFNELMSNYFERNERGDAFLLNSGFLKIHRRYLEVKSKPLRAKLYDDQNIKEHFRSFVNDKKLVLGNVKINCKIIYYLYLNWVYDNKKTKSYGYDLMRIYLNQLIKVTRVGEIRHLHLNIEKFKEGTTENEYKAAIKWSEKNFKEKKNKKVI